jgi:hypothetical protein
MFANEFQVFVNQFPEQNWTLDIPGQSLSSTELLTRRLQEAIGTNWSQESNI